MTKKRPTTSARKAAKQQIFQEAVAEALPRARANLADLRRARATIEQRVKPLRRHLRTARGALAAMATILDEYRTQARNPTALSGVEGFDNFFMPIESTFAARLKTLEELRTVLDRFDPDGLFFSVSRDHGYATKPHDLVVAAVARSRQEFNPLTRQATAALTMPVMMALVRELDDTNTLGDEDLRRSIQRACAARRRARSVPADSGDPPDQRAPPSRRPGKSAARPKAK